MIRAKRMQTGGENVRYNLPCRAVEKGSILKIFLRKVTSPEFVLCAVLWGDFDL